MEPQVKYFNRFFQKINCTLPIPANPQPQAFPAYNDKSRANLKKEISRSQPLKQTSCSEKLKVEKGPNPWELNVVSHHIPEHRKTAISHWKFLWYQIFSYELSRIKYLWPAPSPGRPTKTCLTPMDIQHSRHWDRAEPYLKVPVA